MGHLSHCRPLQPTLVEMGMYSMCCITCTLQFHVMNIWRCGCGQVPLMSMFYCLEKWLYRFSCCRLYLFEIINVISKMRLWTHMSNIQWINSKLLLLLLLFFLGSDRKIVWLQRLPRCLGEWSSALRVSKFWCVFWLSQSGFNFNYHANLWLDF